MLVRAFLAAVVLLPLFWYLGYSLQKSFFGWLPYFGMGLFTNVLPFDFIFTRQAQITIGLTSIINAMTPLFTVLVMGCFQGERLTANRTVSVLLGIVGVAVLRGFEDPIDGTQTLGIALARLVMNLPLCGATGTLPPCHP